MPAVKRRRFCVGATRKAGRRQMSASRGLFGIDPNLLHGADEGLVEGAGYALIAAVEVDDEFVEDGRVGHRR